VWFFFFLIIRNKKKKRQKKGGWGGGGVVNSNFELPLFQSYTKLFSSVIKFCTKSLITQNDIKNYRRDMQDMSGAV